jgi:hypothetical protein
VIPYLAEQYPNPADLVIATNYDEFSYMFYLRATARVRLFGARSRARPRIVPT